MTNRDEASPRMLTSREAAVISAKTIGRDLRRAKSSFMAFYIPNDRSIAQASGKNIALTAI